MGYAVVKSFFNLFFIIFFLDFVCGIYYIIYIRDKGTTTRRNPMYKDDLYECDAYRRPTPMTLEEQLEQKLRDIAIVKEDLELCDGDRFEEDRLYDLLERYNGEVDYLRSMIG